MTAISGETALDVDPRANHLLDALPAAELDRIVPALEAVRLPRPAELEGANEPIEFVYFPTSGVASIVSIDEGGDAVDTAMIGREGMTGLALLLGTGQSPMRTIVQVPLTVRETRTASRPGEPGWLRRDHLIFTRTTSPAVRSMHGDHQQTFAAATFERVRREATVESISRRGPDRLPRPAHG